MSGIDFGSDEFEDEAPQTVSPAEVFEGEKKKDSEKANQDPRQGLPPSVQVVEAAGPMELQLPDESATGPWIVYTGVATVRIMDAAAWKAAGVDSTKYCEWNYLNKKRLPRSMFNDRELQYLLRVDRRFVLED